jgi:hypothetical protein
MATESMVLVRGVAALGSSANCILSALVYVGFAQAIDKLNWLSSTRVSHNFVQPS